MPIDGIVAVQRRIASIAAQLDATLPPARMAPTRDPEAGSFAAALGRAFERKGPSAAPPAPAVAGRIPVPVGGASLLAHAAGRAQPAALMGYGNGRIPAAELAPAGVGAHRLWPPAAEAFAALRSSAAADGVVIGVTDSYRTYDQQVDVAARKGLYSQGGLAAKPGTSNHGWGMAVDLDLDPDAQAWMRANARTFGFVESVPREPWHWEFRPPPS